MSSERNFGIGRNRLERHEAPRTTKQDLIDIKLRSDENLEIIESFSKESDEDKRNIIVSIIGALDYYIHEIVLWGIKAITLDGFKKGTNYDGFRVPINLFKKAIENTSSENIDEIISDEELREEIIKVVQGKGHTYQTWHSIKKGLMLVLPKEDFKEISKLTDGVQGVSAIFQENEIKSLNSSRNKIVHHFDRNYSNASQRNEMMRDINADIGLIKKVIDSVHNVITEYEETTYQSMNNDEAQGE